MTEVIELWRIRARRIGNSLVDSDAETAQGVVFAGSVLGELAGVTVKPTSGSSVTT
jgi:hypothetical protein